MFILLLLFSFILVGCKETAVDNNNNNPNEGKGKEEELEDVTLLFLSSFEEEYFNENIKTVVEEEFPHITLDYLFGDSNSLEELIADGTIPDIFRVVNIGHVKFVAEYEMDYPLDDLIEKFNFDLDTIEPTLIEYLRNQHPEGKLVGLPYNRTIWGTFYNKDIFDAFGQDYPTDDMSWDEIIELAASVTGERNGVQYRGLDVAIPSDAFSAYPVNFTDPETSESRILDEPAFANYFKMIEKLTAIPGNYPDGGEHFKATAFTDGNVAMQTYWGPGLYLLDTPALNWDVVTYPYWDDLPQVGPLANGHLHAISPYSEQKEASFQVIAYLASEEYQMKLSKSGIPSSLVNRKVLDAFGTDIAGADEKNLSAFFDINLSSGPEVVSKYDQFVGLWGEAAEFVDSGDDVNTYLRKLYERHTAIIEEGKVEQGLD